MPITILEFGCKYNDKRFFLNIDCELMSQCF